MTHCQCLTFHNKILNLAGKVEAYLFENFAVNYLIFPLQNKKLELLCDDLRLPA